MRGYARDLRQLVSEGASDDVINARINEQRAAAFRVVAICLGVPPDEFTWEYVDKNKQFTRVGPISPIDFYTTHVKPLFNVDDKVNKNSGGAAPPSTL